MMLRNDYRRTKVRPSRSVISTRNELRYTVIRYNVVGGRSVVIQTIHVMFFLLYGLVLFCLFHGLLSILYGFASDFAVDYLTD